MAALLNSGSRHSYSWWWDSHISPKNSKWLQQNLTDMDAKVKAMIKLIEEDADSFARRAEMYYKKRPELMKLVEEFYRAYRALAERYNNATGELRQAHRTIVQAFPDQSSFPLADDTSPNSEPDAPKTPHSILAVFSPNNSQGLSAPCPSGPGMTRKCLKQLNDMFRSGEEGMKEKNFDGDLCQLSKENQLQKSQIAETELQTLRDALTKLESQRVALLVGYQQSLDKLSNLEKDLCRAQKDASSSERLASEAKAEIQVLKEALRQLEAERDATLLLCRQTLERLTALKVLLYEVWEDTKKKGEPAVEAETESQILKLELERSEAEREELELLYLQCAEKIANLKEKIILTEENVKILNELFEKAEDEVKTLKEEISKLKEDTNAVALLYEQCLETLSKLQQELSEARAENIWLSSEILLGSARLKGAEEQSVLLGEMNVSLQLEAETLAQKVAAADNELSRKNSLLEELTANLQDEHCRFVQVEETLHALQILHSQSQEEQRSLAIELRNGIQKLKDLEISKQELEGEIQRLKDENQTLHAINSSSFLSQKNLQDEMLRLKDIKEKLEAELTCQEERSNALQLQVNNLKEEIEDLCERYQSLMMQMEFLGLDSSSFVSAVRGLQDENTRLRELSKKDQSDREVLLKKLQDMDEILKKNDSLECALSEVTCELQSSNENAKTLQKSWLGLHEEKSTLITEKLALLSQLQIITETMQDLLKKNTSLQTSLCGVIAELEGLKAKSKALEEFCQLLSSERSILLAERSSLSRLEIVEKKLEKMEMRFSHLEQKYDCLEKEEQSALSQVEKLRFSLGVEGGPPSVALTSEARLFGLEGRIQHLEEENKYKKKDFEMHVEKAVDSQIEVFILQKFVQDMEDKIYSLLVECQRLVEVARYSENLITDLENENMIQVVESKILLDKIEMLKGGINEMLKALEIKRVGETEPVEYILRFALANIRNMKTSLSESKDDNLKLLIENAIFSAVLKVVHLECNKLLSKKAALEQEPNLVLEDEKLQHLGRSKQLNVEMDEREKITSLKAELENLHLEQGQVHGSYIALMEEHFANFEKKKLLEEELLRIKNENRILQEGNHAIIQEVLTLSYHSLILESCGTEKALNSHAILEAMDSIAKSYEDLQKEARLLEEKLLIKEIANLVLEASIKKLDEKHIELSTCNGQLRCQISSEKIMLGQKEAELAEAEQNIKDAEALKKESRHTIEYLQREKQISEVTRLAFEKQIIELSEKNKCNEKQIVYLHDVKGDLQSEVEKLHEEIEEFKIREVILASELLERSSEFELWEAEAASFYFDLQITSVREALLEDKVQQLGSCCEDIEHVHSRRNVEFETMKAKVDSLEREAEALRSQLTTCLPLIASLNNNIALIEQNPVLQSKLVVANGVDNQENIEKQEVSLLSSCTLVQLQKLQKRIEVIRDTLDKEKNAEGMEVCVNTNGRLEAALTELEELKSRINDHLQCEHRHSIRESLSEISEGKNWIEMKDIPLDQASGHSFQGVSQRGSGASDEQMLELWEAAEEDSNHGPLISELLEQGPDPVVDEIAFVQNEPVDETTPERQFEKELGIDTLEVRRKGEENQTGTKKNVLERIGYDAQKLMSLQTLIQDLKRKTQPNKRRRTAENVEYETLRGKLQEMENYVVQSLNMNSELMKSFEHTSLTSDKRSETRTDVAGSIHRTVLEQAQREAKKVGRLEQELHRIQNVLLRSDEKTSKERGSMSRSTATILLRDLFYSRGRKNKKPKKGRFCGCLRPASAKN